MDEIYLEIIEDKKKGVEAVKVSLESYIVIVLHAFLKQSDKILINFIKLRDGREGEGIKINLEGLKYDYYNERPKKASYCHLPTYVSSHSIISGLCGVCRKMTKVYMENTKNAGELLGYKDNTLMAPTEISMWTKFCEIDIENCAKTIMSLKSGDLPIEISKYESHLSQPLKLHNIYKLVSNMSKIKISSDDDYRRKAENEKLFNLHENHKFAIGYEMTLADIILFSCYFVIFKKVEMVKVEKKIPLTIKWYKRVEDYLNEICCNLLKDEENLVPIKNAENFNIEVLENYSLYRSDTKKLNLQGDKVVINQTEVEALLEKVKAIGVEIGSELNGREANLFEWDDVPVDAKTEGGKLPDKRVLRKKHQLECLANEVIAIASPNDIIVDFCSGTGHLGILLAAVLPQCQIYLLENKEESLSRARDRVKKLKLENITFVHSNLDYFEGDFDIGVSLHACGVATDIVLEKCLEKRAKFVCCPCCYGKINEIEHIKYPRSEIFRNEITRKEYFCIAHCADQTHDIENVKTNVMKAHQGYFCMDVIDMDRRLKAEELGYQVVQKRLTPENCTPKNRLLVGII